jgi:hypothetical protein
MRPCGTLTITFFALLIFLLFILLVENVPNTNTINF